MTQLPRSVPVYTLDDDCVMSGKSFDFESVEEVAAACLRRVLEICNTIRVERTTEKGSKIKIVLAGWSYGGVISSLIAQQAVLDPNCVNVMSVESIVLFDPSLRTRSKPSGEVVLPILHVDAELATVSGRQEKSADDFAEERAEYHFTHCTALLKMFQVRPVTNSPVECPILYIFPEESEYICGVDAAKEMTNGEVTSIQSPGTHWTMLFGLNASVVGDMVQSYLSKIL